MNFLQNTYGIRNNDTNLTLSSQLAEFGLCPDDWLIEKEGNQKFKIKNIESPDFYFIGELSEKKMKWQKLTLAAI